MKTRLIVVLLGFLGSGMFVACRDDASDKDDDRPGKAVELAFQAKYPGATGVEWESKGVFREADFTLNGREYEAWFNTSGIWLQAEYAVTYTYFMDAGCGYRSARTEKLSRLVCGGIGERGE